MTSFLGMRPGRWYKGAMDGDMLADRVRALHAQGRSTNQIAREVGVPRGTVAPLVRAIAKERASTTPEPELVGCWVSPGWSVGLGLPKKHGWPDRKVRVDHSEGLAAVLIAREHPRDRRSVTVCGYLVDAFCLGVKDALGPKVIGRHKLPDALDRFFAAFDGERLEAPIELVRELVWGAVDYARGLGFEPHRDFRPAAGHLGSWEGPSSIRFGRWGEPCYTQGPYDDVEHILRTLDRNVGPHGYKFAFVISAEALGADSLAAAR